MGCDIHLSVEYRRKTNKNRVDDFDVYDIQWHALVGAMEVLNANQSEVRVVFWFDN